MYVFEVEHHYLSCTLRNMKMAPYIHKTEWIHRFIIRQISGHRPNINQKVEPDVCRPFQSGSFLLARDIAFQNMRTPQAPNRYPYHADSDPTKLRDTQYTHQEAVKSTTTNWSLDFSISSAHSPSLSTNFTILLVVVLRLLLLCGVGWCSAD